MLDGAGTLQGSWLMLNSPQGGAGIRQAAAEVPMQPAEAREFMWRSALVSAQAILAGLLLTCCPCQ